MWLLSIILIAACWGVCDRCGIVGLSWWAKRQKMYKKMSGALFSSVKSSREGKCQWSPLVQVTIHIEKVSPYLFLHGKTRIYLWCNSAKKRKSGQFLICRHVMHIYLFIHAVYCVRTALHGAKQLIVSSWPPVWGGAHSLLPQWAAHSAGGMRLDG